MIRPWVGERLGIWPMDVIFCPADEVTSSLDWLLSEKAHEEACGGAFLEFRKSDSLVSNVLFAPSSLGQWPCSTGCGYYFGEVTKHGTVGASSRNE